MEKYNEKHGKRIRNLAILCLLSIMVLAASTYAWFIGMRTVNVSSFDINVASTEGLYLSMDGKSWTYNLDVANADQYANNENKLEDVELVPMSSVGDMDKTSSRMKLYAKGSLTATTGGYRLLAKRVNNYTNQNVTSHEYIEGDGYVAFDLFIKNLSGDAYYADNNPLNEEGIYLTTNSSVKVADAGTGAEKTGIENSIRVAFAQIGRVVATTKDVATITGITCTDGGSVTGICREASIWEPNDTKHVQNAINWYNTTCDARTGEDVNDPDSYTDRAAPETTNCKAISEGTYSHTYAISNDIEVDDNVNIYDGADYNKYTNNTVDYDTYYEAEDRSTYKLVEYPYFTDTMKNVTGFARQEFMTLAPNSITKVRVYIWLEGQDVDNYDFAQLGKKVLVNFGFTKEKLTEDDFDYDGPSTIITEGNTHFDAQDVITVTTPDTGITFNTETGYFVIPAEYKTNFEFTDGATTYTATYKLVEGVNTWEITQKP